MRAKETDPSQNDGRMAALGKVAGVCARVALVVAVLALGYGLRTDILHRFRAATSTLGGALGMNLQDRSGVVQPTGTSLGSAVIAATDGVGVWARASCSDDAGGSSVVPEGARVTILRVGTRDCAGWRLVQWGDSASWVRERYIAAPTE
jgi:hypothetical protein